MKCVSSTDHTWALLPFKTLAASDRGVFASARAFEVRKHLLLFSQLFILFFSSLFPLLNALSSSSTCGNKNMVFTVLYYGRGYVRLYVSVKSPEQIYRCN